jgi:transcriptional regulator with XRE-family HTH domain
MGNQDDRWRDFGGFIRAQRELRDLSVRQLAELSRVSNPYLSQLERGMYRPSVDVLRNLAGALRISAATMLAEAGLVQESTGEKIDVETAVRLDTHLNTSQKEALLGVYRGFRSMASAPPAPKRKARTASSAAPSVPPAAAERPPQAAPRSRSRRVPPANP